MQKNKVSILFLSTSLVDSKNSNCVVAKDVVVVDVGVVAEDVVVVVVVDVRRSLTCQMCILSAPLIHWQGFLFN